MYLHPGTNFSMLIVLATPLIHLGNRIHYNQCISYYHEFTTLSRIDNYSNRFHMPYRVFLCYLIFFCFHQLKSKHISRREHQRRWEPNQSLLSKSPIWAHELNLLAETSEMDEMQKQKSTLNKWIGRGSSELLCHYLEEEDSWTPCSFAWTWWHSTWIFM